MIVALIGLAVALFSCVVSITLYVLVGLREHEADWLFRAWIVVSVGLAVFLGMLAASYWVNYKNAKKSPGGKEGRGGREKGTPLKALGRKDLQTPSRGYEDSPYTGDGEGINRGSRSTAREPLVKATTSRHDFAHESSPMKTAEHHGSEGKSPVTIVHSTEPEPKTSTPSPAISNALNALSGHKAIPKSMTSPPDHRTDRPCECAICTPPPRFPPQAKLAAQGPSPLAAESEDPFYHDSGSVNSGAMEYSSSTREVSPLTAREEAQIDAQMRRSDSLKKLREATLRRKKAFEALK